MNFAGRRRASPEIKLTSLIDILFIVLTFLVLTTSFKESAVLQLTLPRADTAEPLVRDRPDVIRVLVDAEGGVFLGQEEIAVPELVRQLDGVAPKSDATVLLTADATVNHGRVIEVMDAVRRAGINRLSIETLREGARERRP